MGKSINKVRGTALILGILAIAFAFFTRIVSIFEYVTFDIGPDPDQITFGYLWMDMWKGNFPQLGLAGGGKIWIRNSPPLYLFRVSSDNFRYRSRISSAYQWPIFFSIDSPLNLLCLSTFGKCRKR